MQPKEISPFDDTVPTMLEFDELRARARISTVFRRSSTSLDCVARRLHSAAMRPPRSLPSTPMPRRKTVLILARALMHTHSLPSEAVVSECALTLRPPSPQQNQDLLDYSLKGTQCQGIAREALEFFILADPSHRDPDRCLPRQSPRASEPSRGARRTPVLPRFAGGTG